MLFSNGLRLRDPVKLLMLRLDFGGGEVSLRIG
jgi:hypothetical protein